MASMKSPDSAPTFSFPVGTSAKTKNAFCRLADSLMASGFHPLYAPALCPPGETVFNRGVGPDGQDNGKSNFFVFVRLEGDSLRVMFNNPDTSASAIHLPPSAQRRLFTLRSSNSSKVEAIVEEVRATAAKKSETNYSILLHGHTGSIDGLDLLEAHRDDGRSDEVDIIRQLMLYNYDLDASGMHNNFVLALFSRQEQLEAQAGIRKLPSVEATLPLSNWGCNGAHENLWFASPQTGADYHEEFFVDRRGKYPPYATMRSEEEMMGANRELVRAGRLAIGIAHPAASSMNSWLGILTQGIPNARIWDQFYDHVQNDVAGIGAFNFDILYHRTLACDNPSEQALIEGWVAKHQTGRKAWLSAVNRAFALEMRERYGKFLYADHDIHEYFPLRYNSTIHQLGTMTTMLDFSSGAPRTAKPTAQEVVSLMYASDAASRIQAFIPYDPQTGGLVDERDHLAFSDKVRSIVGSVERKRHEVGVIWGELVEKVRSLYH